jgi:hypothetical protein
MCAILAWEARNDAMAAGIGSGESKYESEEMLVLG